MATAFSPANSVTVTTAANFIPEIWSDEIVAAYKKNLVLANVVMKMNFRGKKGDTVHVPAPTRGAASAKGATNAVTLIAATETEVQISINKHYEYSRLIEDIVEAQALNSLRQFYTSDAGYALAKQVDTDLVQLGRAFNGATVGTDDYATSNTATKAYIGGDGTTARHLAGRLRRQRHRDHSGQRRSGRGAGGGRTVRGGAQDMDRSAAAKRQGRHPGSGKARHDPACKEGAGGKEGWCDPPGARQWLRDAGHGRRLRGAYDCSSRRRAWNDDDDDVNFRIALACFRY